MGKILNIEKIIELHSLGLSNRKISKSLNYDEHAVGRKLKSLNLTSNKSGSEILFLTREQKEVLIGTIMGDGCLKKAGNSTHYKLSITHCDSQKEYLYHKASIFKNICTDNAIHKNYVLNNYTNKFNNTYSLDTKHIKDLDYFAESFYNERKKIIPFNLLKEFFTEKSLAFLFMDDGNINGKSININICSFSEEQQLLFCNFLKDKFNLEFTLQKNRKYKRLYLRSKSVNKFIDMVYPYIIPSMLYKLPMSSLNSVNLGKSL